MVGESVVRGRLPGASAAGWSSSSQNIWARLPRQKPSSGITGDDCSQPPDGVAEIMLPAWSMMSKCTVSPRTSPKRPTVGSPAPMAPTASRWLAARVIVGVRQQGRDRNVGEFGIAVEFFAIGKGKLGAFDLEMDEFGPGWI